MEKKGNDIQAVQLKDLLDISALQNLTDSFSKVTGIPTAILDLSGNILITSWWREICTRFHRKNPDTASKCLESDTVLANKLARGELYNVYKCKNGLVDIAVPIIIDNSHLGNLFAGQFFFEPPDIDFFSRQAEEYGFDKAPYLKALSEVPVLPPEKIKQALNFLTDLTDIVASSGIDKKKLFELNVHLEQRINDRTASLETEIRHRKRTETELQRHIEFERLASGILSELAGSNAGDLDSIINRTLESVGNFTKADRAYVFQYQKGGALVDNTHEWCAEGIEPQIKKLKNIILDNELPRFATQIRKRKIFHVPDVASLSSEFFLERKHFTAQGIQSMIAVPIVTAIRLNGFLGFDSVRCIRAWTEDDRNLLRFIGETVGQVIERIRVEEAFRESEARWQFALTGAGDGVWDWDAVSNRVYYSTHWKTMLGYEEDDIGDTLDEWESRVHPEDLAGAHSEMERHFKGETQVYLNAHRLRCRDGSYKWILDRGKVIEWSEEGRPLRMIGTHTDISESKKLQAKYETLIAELREALTRVKQLSGLLPICSHCKKIRDDKGYWKQIESYIKEHTDAEFSHSICQECAKKYYPDLYDPDDYEMAEKSKPS